MKKHLLHFVLVACTISAIAQTLTPSLLNEKPLADRLYERQVQKQIELSKALAARNLEARTLGPNGIIKEAVYVTPSGHIVYNTTYNIGAGRTLSTNKVWPGGTVGVSLTGAGMTNRLGIWDGGAVLTSHQEFGGRVTQTDGSSTLSNHATHVAGTMIASGVDANAKGMSYQATLKAYDWTNDETEMASAAAAGMLISNHSYGSISGWYYNTGNSRWEWFGDASISTVEDYKFGYYDNGAQSWDDIAQSYPNYLICKAAGNDRGENLSGSTWYYADGTQGSGTAPAKDGGTLGYDCIATNGTAKNVLTVGAVNKIGGNTGNGWTKASDVVMSSFSGWGPTDDGRIKPDVVSPGVSIYSAISTGTTAYDTYNGTSMATPAASGSLLLVQQHYFARKGKYMRSASLKGLAIHTADEAGTTTGPDYKFGWGLLNTAACVTFINDSSMNKLNERILNNGVPQSLQFSADAGKPLKVTICWTDKSGTPVTSNELDNTTKMLVNDLDIRLTRNSDNTIFSPYILDPANPANAATTGDNTRDNVEMIYLATPQAGNYTLSITHKGTLSGSTQPFSLLISNGTEKTLAQFTSSKTIICPGQTITFTDGSTGAVSQRTWYFPGGNPATSTATNPTVTYPTAGKYAVALKVTGSLGSDSVYKNNWITVGGIAIPFTETFETNSPTLSSWSTANADAASSGITWGIYTIAGTTPGTAAAGIPLFDYSTTGQRDGLICPALNLSTHTNASLTFKHAYTRYGGSSQTDSLVVWASTNCGTSWVRIASYGENGTGNFATYADGGYTLGSQNTFSPAAATSWCGGGTGSGCKTISLAQFAGQTSVTLKFESYNNYGNNLYIDNISVDGTPIKPVASFNGPTQACIDVPVSFTDKSSNIPTAWVWTVTGPINLSSTQQNPSFTFTAAGTYTIKLKASNVTGADSITSTNYITVGAKPSTPNIYATGATQICLGDSVLLSTDSTGSINWYADGVKIAQNVQQIYAKQTATYSVALSNGVCESSSTINVTATVKPSPALVTASIPGVAFCPGGSVTLTSNSTSGNQWYKNGSAISGATSITYTLVDSGSYHNIVTKTGCSSLPSNVKTFTMLVRPTVDAIVGNFSPTRGEANSYNVTAVSGNTYTWSILNGTILSGNGTATISARFNVVDSGTLTVQARNSIGCFSTPSSKKMMVSPAVGITEVLSEKNVTVYPIPAKTILNIKLDGVEAQQADLKLVNLLGQIVYTHAITINAGINNFQIDVTGLQKGIYLLELQGEQSRAAKRVIVE